MTDTALSPEEQLIEDIAGFTHDPLGYALYAFPWGEEGVNAKIIGRFSPFLMSAIGH